MPVLLAIETSGDACSVALAQGARGEQVHALHRVEARAHARTLLPMIETLLAEAGQSMAALDGIAFGRGPGSFTGLRIAAAVTQGLAWARDLPVYDCSSLAALARTALVEVDRAAPSPAGVVVLVDARMGELYWNAWRCEGDRIEALGEDRLDAPAHLAAPLAALPAGDWLFAGDGLAHEALIVPAFERVAARLPGTLPEARQLLPEALARAARGDGVSADRAVP
ncbi:MAG TPA: tRNA (adenosine(37)-N6)-threonylcarbamoyltransferase complex dimerization subunit type 1 TsaB, partial [Pseudomonadales bacterium]|nr:tRNA (adenosine(37)-N6)-threonylcarbamoyltransferase complex dimerization subunit type 1 TsaB [Pseudomonadales bacterium]